MTGGLLLQVAAAIALTVVAVAVAHWLRAERRARLWLEQRVAERTGDLAEANRRLTSANRAKTEFLANMSHEIRTPLSAILGFADVLEDERLDRRERREAVRVIRRNSEHLLAILSNILDIAKIEAGKLRVEEIACSPREIAEEVSALLRNRAEAKGIRLLLRIESPAIPRRMRSDPTRLRQILVNLVGNAIKFTEQGMVTLAVGLEMPAPGHATDGPGLAGMPGLRFEVRDSGIGMSAAELERVFADFEQADATITRRYGGSGLGLPICRRLTAALGGALTAHSTRGQGSTFKLVLPLREVDQVVEDLNETAIVAPRGIPPRRGLRVLVADDASDIQLLIARFLADIDAKVTTAGSGRHAVDAVLAAHAEARPFDLILMDLHMPELDGADAVKTLRAAGVETPIVALTGSAYVEDRDRCIRAGYSGLLLKPVDRGELIQHIATLTGVDPRVLGPRPAVPDPLPPVAPPASAAPAFDAARLLAMVGGDEDARRALMSLFQSDAPSLVQAIQGAASSGDTAAVRAGAHKIKGMLLNVCAPHAAGVAAELESLARNGDSQRFQSLAGRLQTEVNRVCGSMAGA